MNIKTLLSLTITTTLLILFQTSAFAGIYKWVDDNGLVHYGEKPIGTEAKKVIIRKNTTTKPRAIKKDEEAEEGKSGEGQNTEEAPKPVEVELPKKEQRKLCSEARSDVAAINSRGRLREISAKGEYTYLSDKQKQQRLSAAKKKQSKYCH